MGSVFANASLVNKIDVCFLVIEVSQLGNTMIAEKYLSNCRSWCSLDSVCHLLLSLLIFHMSKPKASRTAGVLPGDFLFSFFCLDF